jgi:hypothetical protein
VMLLLLSWKGYSQSDTKDDDTARVRLKVPTAMKAYIDLVKYDELKERSDLHEKIISNLEEVIKRKDESIKEKDQLITSLRTVNTDYSSLIRAKDDKYNGLEKLYKKSVRAGRFKIVLLTGALAGAGYLLLK